MECCARGHRCPTLDQISDCFHVEPGDILNVYVVGSHMWGTCSSRSDWDIVIVVKDLKTKTLKCQNVHKGSLEAFILPKEQYKDHLAAHSMQVLLTLWLPEYCIRKQTFDPKTIFTFSEEKLIASLAASRDRDIRIAEKHFRKGDSGQAKKVLIHCIRYLDMGTQIKSMDRGGSLDYSSPDQFREQVLGNCSKNWEDLIVPVQELLGDLWCKLVH